MSYNVGKHEVQRMLADAAVAAQLDGSPFSLRDFHDFADVFERYLPERNVSRIDARQDESPRDENPHEQFVDAELLSDYQFWADEEAA